MPNERIGRYVIKSVIGQGGMAGVYRGYDPLFDRDVAIKILPREFLSDPTFRGLFEREAKIIASLEHPSIVPVYDFGEEDGQLYLVMRLMLGGTLAERLSHGPIPLKEASAIISRLAPALDYAHARGIIHRDLKPENILFDQRGEPYLSDFGIAKLAGSQKTLTSRVIVGTPAYMSPEQARNDPGIDGRCDIYSLGAILFQMLTGRLPYEADTPTGQILKHVNEPIPNILLVKKDLPADCQVVINRAMAKQTNERYGNIEEMGRDLEKVSKGEGLVTLSQPRPTLVPPPIRPIQLNPRRLWGVWIPVFAALLAGLGWVFYRAVNSPFPTNSQASPTITQVTALSTVTPLPVCMKFGSATVIQAQPGAAYFQSPNQTVVSLEAWTIHCAGNRAKVWTTAGTAELRLSDQSGIYLAPDTSLNLEGVSGGGSQADLTTLGLEKGRLLVIAAHLYIRTANSSFQAVVDHGVMGISYEPGAGRTQVDCLKGRCQVGEQTTQDLYTGQQLDFVHGIPGDVRAADAQPWIALFGDIVPAPTVLPTPSASPTITATISPTWTASPTRTLKPIIKTPTPTKTRHPRPSSNSTYPGPSGPKEPTIPP